MIYLIICILVFLLAKFMHDNLMPRIDIESIQRENNYLKRESIDENRYYAYNALLRTLCVMPLCFKPQTAY